MKKPMFAEFPKPTAADWRKAAEESLKGAPFEKKLITRTPEGIDLQPMYSELESSPVTAAAWPGLAPYVRGASALGQRATGWAICQVPAAREPKAFNAALISALNRGQNAVSLPLYCGLPLSTAADLATVLQGVDLTAVPLFAQGGASATAFAGLVADWLKANGKAVSALTGAITADPIASWLVTGKLPVSFDAACDDLAKLATWAKDSGAAVRTVGVDASIWTDAGANAVQELAFALATGVEYFQQLVKRGLPVEGLGSKFLFTFGLGSNVFMEIAKLRAARLLWARAVQVAGGTSADQAMVSHGRTSTWNKTVLDMHVNILRTTAEGFAGVVGGCDGLQISPFNECTGQVDEMSERLARNIQIMLAEECQLARVVDPAGGSYYVESLTRQLAEKAWALFQDVVREGGMAAAIQKGMPQGLVAKTAADRISAVQARRDGVIGTNLHPNLKEKVTFPAAASKPADATIQPLVAVRRSEPFEKLRQRSEAFLARTGARPKVFLATFGPRKQHAARADFSTGFFAAGGFECSTPAKGFDTADAASAAALASGAPIVVLCSTDETYPELVPAAAKALKAGAKAPFVVLAGAPATPELEAQFKEAGVDEFIHLRANCAKLLAALQDKLGL